MRLTAEQRFWSKVGKIDGGCWIWIGQKNTQGYGVFSPVDRRTNGVRERKVVLAHRYSWELIKGKIPDGMCIDHRVCRNKACCNPDHLVVCTLTENILQPDGAPYINAAKTHCPRGHPYVPSNIYINSSDGRSKRCRTCTLEYANKRYRSRQRQ
jgi:hypothetical protein